MALKNEAIVTNKSQKPPYLSEQALLADMTPYTAHTDALIQAKGVLNELSGNDVESFFVLTRRNEES
ncbi:MAG: hypothetical protein AAF669_01580 [Pseudomonadota bacterium]